MEERNLVFVLSDIHMGTDVPTVWYRREIHEKYLMAVLNRIIELAKQIEEVILLGDIFEFWSYPPNQLPPSMNDIISTHPNILGENGKLREVLSALKGRVTFIPGDHDINVKQAELNHIKSKDGYTIKYHYGPYIPIYDTHIQFMHGHECTSLNAPYFVGHLAPLPIGYFVCRAMSYKIQNILKKRPNKSICDLDEYGSYGHNDFLAKLPFFYENFQEEYNTVESFFDALEQVTKIPGDLPIQINPFESITLNEVRKIYQNKGILGHEINLESIMKGYNTMFVHDDVVLRCIKGTVDTVVMGHTHSSMISEQSIHLVNTGYMCPPVSKLLLNPVTFGEYDIFQRKFDLVTVTGNKYIQITNPQKKNNLKLNSKENLNKETNNVKAQNRIPPPDSFTFGWSVYDTSLEFWQVVQMGVLSKANELGINIITSDEKGNSIDMILGSIDLINQGIDALVISPYNPELMPVVVEYANRFNVPVIAIDTGTGGAKVAAFIVSDNFGGGVLAGEYALELINDKNIQSKNFAIIKVVENSLNAALRGEGFGNVLTEAGYQLVAQVSGNSLEEDAYWQMKGILSAYGDDLAVVFAESGPMAIGASRAIAEAGKKGIILVIGFDSEPFVIEAIKEGFIQGTIGQYPYQMGELGVEIANSILLGNEVVFDDSQNKIILLEVYLVNEQGEITNSII